MHLYGHTPGAATGVHLSAPSMRWTWKWVFGVIGSLEMLLGSLLARLRVRSLVAKLLFNKLADGFWGQASLRLRADDASSEGAL